MGSRHRAQPLSQPGPGRFGRRPTFLLSLALAVPVGLGVALAVDFLMVLVARLLFGAALAGAFLALYVARECDGGGRGGVGTEGAPGCTGSRMLQAVACPRMQNGLGYRMLQGVGWMPCVLGTHGGPLTLCQGWSCVTPHTGWG